LSASSSRAAGVVNHPGLIQHVSAIGDIERTCMMRFTKSEILDELMRQD
jgi:hypothetical protein